MAGRIWSGVTTLIVGMLAQGALAQDKPLELTPAGKAILQGQLAADRAALNNPSGPIKPATFPLPICAFPGGLCGAVNRDGTIAVRPQYDWVGKFWDKRAAVRLGGLYGLSTKKDAKSSSRNIASSTTTSSVSRKSMSTASRA
jgi:hypothetical protein